MIYPACLVEMAGFLRRREGLLPEEKGDDGRFDSAAEEGRIISLLEDEVARPRDWEIERAKARGWFDFAVVDGGERHYVDLKISRLSGRDNTNAKRAVYYVLTGDCPEGVSTRDDAFFRALRKNMKENDRDYYYLVIGRNEEVGSPKRAFLTSLRTIGELHPNANNMPFQCVWGDCTEPRRRSHEEVKVHLLGAWSESVRRALRKHEGMAKHFPEYFPELGKGGAP